MADVYDVRAASLDHLQRRRVVVVEAVAGHLLEGASGVLPVLLHAEVVDFAGSAEFLLEEALDLCERVAVGALEACGREAHRDDALGDVCVKGRYR